MPHQRGKGEEIYFERRIRINERMSIKLMSSIFDTEFRDLKDAEGNTTKASTAKLVLLAMADHANDEGEGAYPGLEKMTIKTALTKQAIIKTYDALKYNGIIFLEGKSKLGTNNYTINTGSFAKFEQGKPGLLVNPVEQQGKPSLPEVVNPVYPNHTLTTKNHKDVKALAKFSEKSNEMERLIRVMEERIEFELYVKPDISDPKWKKTVREIVKLEERGQSFETFVKWMNSGSGYNRPKPHQIANNPKLLLTVWPQAFQQKDKKENNETVVEDWQKGLKF